MVSICIHRRHWQRHCKQHNNNDSYQPRGSHNVIRPNKDITDPLFFPSNSLFFSEEVYRMIVCSCFVLLLLIILCSLWKFFQNFIKNKRGSKVNNFHSLKVFCIVLPIFFCYNVELKTMLPKYFQFISFRK